MFSNDESPELPLTAVAIQHTHTPHGFIAWAHYRQTTVRLYFSLYGGSGKDPTKVKYAGARRREDHGGGLATEVRYFGVKSCCRPRVPQ